MLRYAGSRVLGARDALPVQRRAAAHLSRRVPTALGALAPRERRGLVTPDPNSRQRTTKKGYLEAAAAHGGPDAFPTVRPLDQAPEEIKFFSHVSTVDTIRALCQTHLPGWGELDPGCIEIDQLCEGLTNQNFRVHLGVDPPVAANPCVLFRIYGKDVHTLYNPDLEVRTVSMLARYNIGPKIFASGDEWRIEEWHSSVPLPNRSMRNPSILVQVAAQFGRLHKLPLRLDFPREILSTQPRSHERLSSWAEGCAKAAASFTHPDAIKQIKNLDLENLLAEREWALKFALADDPKVKGSGLDEVFSHCNSHENNILQTEYGLRIVDFEYAGMDHQAFDIAGYWIECTIDYLVDKDPFYRVNLGDFPTDAEQRLFCSIYLSEYFEMAVSMNDPAVTVLMSRVQRFVLINHLLWAMWSVIRAPQAQTFSDFDFLRYAASRWFMYKWTKRAILHGT